MTDNERFKRAREIFERTIEVDPADRDAFVARECGDDAELLAEVQGLLKTYDAAPDSFLEKTPLDLGEHAAPAEIGPYKIVSKIGEGGMGAVYLAEQAEPIRRKVAIKLIKPGLDSQQVVSRFQAEQQALAMMNHVNIAKVFDAGTTDDGRPYFVMEYIEGVTLLEYCDEAEAPIHERVRLFMQVCEGVQYAHQQGIIHRDIKPGNIIVTGSGEQATPKIIDFGIAKATEQTLTEETFLTREGELIGTLEYMSPEQADRVAADTRSDVYSLGVVFYELLTGSLPFEPKELRESGFEAILRHLREVDPPVPSARVSGMGSAGRDTAARRHSEPKSLVRTLSGDLDWITMKAMEKDPGRRYVSPMMFADDLRRYLNNEPVVARAPSAAYRARKFIRRHGIAVAFVSVIFVAIAAFAVNQTLQAQRLAAERDRANLEAESAQAVADFMIEVFGEADPEIAQGEEFTVRHAVDAGAQRIREDEDMDPVVRATIMNALGRIYRQLSELSLADTLTQQAVAEMLEHGAPPIRTVTACYNAAYILQALDRYDEGLEYCNKGIEIAESNFPPGHEARLRIYGITALMQKRLGNYEEAVAGHERVIAALEVSDLPHEKRTDRIGVNYNNMGLVYIRLDQPDKAKECYEKALALYRSVHGEKHPKIAGTTGNLAEAYVTLGELDKAAETQRIATQLCIEVYGPEHRSVGTQYNTEGNISSRLGDYEKAIEYYDKAYEIWAKALGPDHHYLYYPYKNKGEIYMKTEQYPLALEMYMKARDIYLNALGPEHNLMAFAEFQVGDVMGQMGDDAGAEPYLRRAYERALDHRPQTDISIRTKVWLGWCYLNQEKYAEAEPPLMEAHEIVWDNDIEPWKAYTVEPLVKLYSETGREDLAAEQQTILDGLNESQGENEE